MNHFILYLYTIFRFIFLYRLFGAGTVGNCLAIHMYAFIRTIQQHDWSVMHNSVEAIQKKMYHRQGKVVYLISHFSSIRCHGGIGTGYTYRIRYTY